MEGLVRVSFPFGLGQQMPIEMATNRTSEEGGMLHPSPYFMPQPFLTPIMQPSNLSLFPGALSNSSNTIASSSSNSSSFLPPLPPLQTNQANAISADLINAALLKHEEEVAAGILEASEVKVDETANGSEEVEGGGGDDGAVGNDDPLDSTDQEFRPYDDNSLRERHSRAHRSNHGIDFSMDNGSTCSECGKTFGNRASLAQHMAVHSAVKPFKCPHCSYASVRNGDLKKHLRHHERTFAR